LEFLHYIKGMKSSCCITGQKHPKSVNGLKSERPLRGRCLPHPLCHAWARSLASSWVRQSSRPELAPGKSFVLHAKMLSSGFACQTLLPYLSSIAIPVHRISLPIRRSARHRLVKVEYEDLPAILNLDDAIKSDSYFTVRPKDLWISFGLVSLLSHVPGQAQHASSPSEQHFRVPIVPTFHLRRSGNTASTRVTSRRRSPAATMCWRATPRWAAR
jgi:hypothetical protein